MRDISEDRTKYVTYGQFVYVVRPEKVAQNKTHFTVRGARINHSGEVATPTSNEEILILGMRISVPYN